MNVLNPSPLHQNNNKQKNTPPRGTNAQGNGNKKKPILTNKMPHITNKHTHNIDDTSSSGSSDDDEVDAISTKKSVVIIHDDLMTEDDTDTEEDELMGLAAHESGDVPSLLLKDSSNNKKGGNDNEYEYNAYTSHHDDIYHPTSSIFEDTVNNNNNNNNNQTGLFNDGENINTSFLASQFSTSEETFLQDTSFYERAAFNRRPSQLHHEMTTLNALCPPSHVLKARRLSKNPIKTSTSTPITPVKSLSTTSLSSSCIREKRKPSIVDNYTKEFSNNNNSAVSPRFMARKLSEVTTLPAHFVSDSAVPPVPPVPQIPSVYNNAAGDRNATTTTTSTKDNSTTSSNENQILAHIDDIIETQLRFHLGQVVWRASETHLEARRFWEEQKKEMFGFATTLVDRMENQEDMTRRMTLESFISASTPTTPPDENKEEEKEIDLLRKELNLYKSKSQRQLFELEMLKTRNSELEKQHEIDTISIAKQWEDKDSTLKRLNQLEHQERKQLPVRNSTSLKQKDVQTKLFNLETENNQLKNQIKQMQDVNRQLLEDATTFETSLNNRDKEIKQFKHQLSEAELQLVKTKRKMTPTESSTTTATRGEGGLDCSEDFGMKVNTKDTSNKCTNNKDTIKSTNKETVKDTVKNIDNKDETKTDASNDDIKKSENWADIMESEDEAKKSVEDWATKYRELQAVYFDVCSQLEKANKDSVSSENEKKILELSQSMVAKDEEIRQLKQVESVSRIQMDYLQLELDKFQNVSLSSALDIKQYSIKQQQQKAVYCTKRKIQQLKSAHFTTPATTTTTINLPAVSSSPTPPPTTSIANKKPDYVAEDGFLTFTTEINGKLSKYSIKLPQMNDRNELMTKTNKLNPNAVTWTS